MHDSGMGYRKIARWLYENAYKTIRGNEFKNTHVFSVLKKKKLRDRRLNNFHKFEKPETDKSELQCPTPTMVPALRGGLGWA